MVSTQRMLWMSGVALVLAPTLWLVYLAYFSPPSYIGTTKMMVAGKLVISPTPELAQAQPLPQTPQVSYIPEHRNDFIAFGVVSTLYLPGVMLLLAAALRRRRIHAATPTT